MKLMCLTTTVLFITIQLNLFKSCLGNRSGNPKNLEKDNEKYARYMNDEYMSVEKAKCEEWIKNNNNRYHPYYNPDPSRNKPKICKEPILAKSKKPNLNDPMIKYSEEMFNLAKRGGIGYPLMDFCVLELIDKSKKFEKNYTYIPSSFAEDVFLNPDIDFPESFKNLKFKGRIILAAISINNRSHWAAIKADTNKRIIEWYNSGDPTLTNSVYKNEGLKHLEQFLKILKRRNEEIPNDRVNTNEWKLNAPTYKFKKQDDELNCGTYVMMFIDKTLHNGKLSFVAKDVFEYRSELQNYLVDKMIIKKPVEKKSKGRKPVQTKKVIRKESSNKKSK